MKALGWYQIVGAAIGLYCVAYLLLHQGTITGGNLLAFMIAVALYAFSLYCGNLLRKTNIKGLQLSTWNQALQVLQLTVWAFSFEYYSGVKLAFGFRWDEVFKPDISLSLSGFYIRYNTDSTSELSVWINVIPINIIYWIGKIENDIEQRKQIMESATKVSEEYN